MQETWVRSLGQEDLLEKEMATRSSILAGKIPWTEEPGGLQSMGWQRVGNDLATKQQQIAEEILCYGSATQKVKLFMSLNSKEEQEHVFTQNRNHCSHRSRVMQEMYGHSQVLFGGIDARRAPALKLLTI